MNPGPRESREELLMRLAELFRERGFEGVSIGDISTATGLGRSSLYHYFPGGKDEMAEAVIRFARGALEQEIFAPLAEAGTVSERVDRMIDAMMRIYDGGRAPCVLAAFLSGPKDGPLATGAAGTIRAWIDAIVEALRGLELDACERHRRAVSMLAHMQGALVLSRALNDPGVFRKAMEVVRALLLSQPADASGGDRGSSTDRS